MANDKHIGLKSVGSPTRPAIENVQWLKSARKINVHQIYSAQDRPVAASRRVLCRYGMSGESYHTYGDVRIDPDEGDDLNSGTEGAATGYDPYPEFDDERELIEVYRVPITPGCIVAAKLTALPSGPCWENTFLPDAEYQGNQGTVRVDVEWDDGTTQETTSAVLSVFGDTSPDGYVTDSPGAAWDSMFTDSTRIAPNGFLNTRADATEWSQSGVVATITITAVGNPRIMDIVVYEDPVIISRENGTPAGPAHIYSVAGKPETQVPDDYPFEGASSGDRRFGAQHALNVARQHEVDLGPALWSWTSERESYGPRTEVLGTSTPAVFDGTSETVLGESASGTAADSPRIGIGCAAYGRQHATSDPQKVMAENGCCPVVFAANWSVAAGTGTIRLQADDYSEVELSTTSTSYGWSRAITHLASGAHPLDGFRGLVSGENSGSNETRVRYACAYYWPIDT